MTPKTTDPDPVDDALADLSLDDLIGPGASDPDEAIVKCIMQARGVAAAFGMAADRARPQLSWRCEGMAALIAEGLRCYFNPPDDAAGGPHTE